MEEEGKEFYEDFTSDQIKEIPTNNMKKYLIIAAISAIIILSIIIILLVLFNKKKSKSLGTISCIYFIKSSSEMSSIISDEYEKESKFDIVIEDKAIPYNKKYQFSKDGDNTVIFE